jgi:hypothetical protein
MSFCKSFSLLLTCALLSACGGGSTASAPPPVVQPPPVAIFGGIWFGEMTIDSALGSELCGALITEDGQFRFLCAFTDLQLVGMSSRDANALTGSGLALSTLAFLDGTFVSDLSLQATLVSKTSLVGTWSTAAGDAGSFDMLYDPMYEAPSSLSLFEGVWQGTDELGNPNVTFTIDDLGSFTAQNSNGCLSSGMFLISDGRYTLVQLSSTISACEIAGDYAGLAFVYDDLVPNDTLLISISNDQRALLVELQKMP